jgi:hypothetical protein
LPEKVACEGANLKATITAFRISMEEKAGQAELTVPQTAFLVRRCRGL